MGGGERRGGWGEGRVEILRRGGRWLLKRVGGEVIDGFWFWRWEDGGGSGGEVSAGEAC